jgi:acetyl esterase/lipase
MRFTFLIFVLLLVGCSSRKINNISYLQSSDKTATVTPNLNVFVPKRAKKTPSVVLIFVHGGNWNSGNKETYNLMGRNFAAKGVVTVIPDYTLSPFADYDTMTKEIASVIQWTKENIKKYNGDPNQVFITGHSAGGHLGALAVMNPKYGIDSAAISGIILNDAAGLDMKHYLQENPPTAMDDYLTTWTKEPDSWQQASPIYFLDKATPPFLIYVGDKTYPSIKVANSRFVDALHSYQPNVTPIHLNKKHVPMVVQYFWPWSNRFDEVIEFMNTNKK